MSALASYLVAIGWDSQEASFVGVSQQYGLTTTGANQSTAYPLTGTINTFTTVPPGADGARLPSIAQYKHAWILVANLGALDLKLYPASGEEIGGAGVNVAKTLIKEWTILLFPISSTRWGGVSAKI